MVSCIEANLVMASHSTTTLASEFDIKVINPKGIRSQVLSNLLAQLPLGEHELLHEDLPCAVINGVETKE